jgi:hypothetical protein
MAIDNAFVAGAEAMPSRWTSARPRETAESTTAESAEAAVVGLVTISTPHEAIPSPRAGWRPSRGGGRHELAAERSTRDGRECGSTGVSVRLCPAWVSTTTGDAVGETPGLRAPLAERTTQKMRSAQRLTQHQGDARMFCESPCGPEPVMVPTRCRAHSYGQDEGTTSWERTGSRCRSCCEPSELAGLGDGRGAAGSPKAVTRSPAQG